MEFCIVLRVLARATQEKEVKKTWKENEDVKVILYKGTKAPSPEWSSLMKVNNPLETELRLYLNWGSLTLYYSDAVDGCTRIRIGNKCVRVEVCDLLAAEEFFFVTLIRASSFPIKQAFLEMKHSLGIWLIRMCRGFYTLEKFGIRSLNIRQKHDSNNSFDSSYCILARV